MWCPGLVAPRHVESSWARDRTRFSGIDRQILNHWPTRKVPVLVSKYLFIWLSPGLVVACGIWFPDQDGTWAHSVGSKVLATEPPGKSLREVLIYVFLMASEVEQIFILLLDVCLWRSHC